MYEGLGDDKESILGMENDSWAILITKLQNYFYCKMSKVFLQQLDNLERRMDAAISKSNDCVAGCDEVFKRLSDSLRKEHEKQIAMSQIQNESISSLALKLQDEFKSIKEENLKSHTRLLKIVEIRFERISGMLQAKAHNDEASEQLRQPSKISQDLELRSLVESYENEFSIADCRLEMKMHATFDELHSAVLRERTLREDDEAKLFAVLEIAVIPLNVITLLNCKTASNLIGLGLRA